MLRIPRMDYGIKMAGFLNGGACLGIPGLEGRVARKVRHVVHS